MKGQSTPTLTPPLPLQPHWSPKAFPEVVVVVSQNEECCRCSSITCSTCTLVWWHTACVIYRLYITQLRYSGAKWSNVVVVHWRQHFIRCRVNACGLLWGGSWPMQNYTTNIANPTNTNTEQCKDQGSQFSAPKAEVCGGGGEHWLPTSTLNGIGRIKSTSMSSSIISNLYSSLSLSLPHWLSEWTRKAEKKVNFETNFDRNGTKDTLQSEYY